MRYSSILLCFLATVHLSLTARAWNPEPIADVQMLWKPTNSLKDLNQLNIASISSKVKIAKLTDGREVKLKNKVGENRESDSPKPVTTRSDVAEFVTENLTSTLKKSGLEIVETGADFVLSGEILEYFVTETNTYEGTLSIKFTLKKGDKVVWKGVITSTETRFGRSYKYDNYMEVLSDCLINLAAELFKNTEFRAKLK